MTDTTERAKKLLADATPDWKVNGTGVYYDPDPDDDNDPDDVFFARGPYRRIRSQAEADAALIAAAPTIIRELIEEVERLRADLVAGIGEMDIVCDEIERMRPVYEEALIEPCGRIGDHPCSHYPDDVDTWCSHCLACRAAKEATDA